MQDLGAILKSKLLHQPRFKEALVFGKIKTCIDTFLRSRNIDGQVSGFEEKTKTLTIKTPHPAYAREILTLHTSLTNLLKKEGLGEVKKIITTR